MNNNLYWSIYKNLEHELIILSNQIYINDEQLNIYSVKISELLIRTAVEVESISKELYFNNGGDKPNDNKLFFDSDCLNFLEKKWILSKKQIIVSSPNIYLNLNENNTLTPLKKANKKGSSSSDWLKAYQAIKHNRAKNLKRGNLKHLIRALGALFILNIYYKDHSFNLESDKNAINFDRNLGSDIFSIKLSLSSNFSVDRNFIKESDFVQCIYFVWAAEETRKDFQILLEEINSKARENVKSHFKEEAQNIFSKIKDLDIEATKNELTELINKMNRNFQQKIAAENSIRFKKTYENLRYEAVLNKNQLE